MANVLTLNQPFVTTATGDNTFTIPSSGLYSVQVSGSVQSAIATGDGAGSGTGLGAGKGGGTLSGFAVGGSSGAGAGGQGFGPDTSGYQQPPAAGSNQTVGPAVSSGMVIIVKQNGATVFTMPTLSPTQETFQFKFGFLAAAADAMIVNLTSATSSDLVPNSFKVTIALNQGL